MGERVFPHAARALAVVCALLAVVNPSIGDHDGVLRVVALDVSDSARPGDVTRALRERLGGLRGRDRVAWILFGDGARTVGPMSPDDASSVRVDERVPLSALAGATSFRALSGAVRGAVAGARAGERVEVVLLTDGRFTDVEGDGAGTPLRLGGAAEITVVALPTRPLGSRVTAVLGPGAVGAGDAFDVEVRGVCERAEDRVEVLLGGRVRSRLPVAAGPFRVAARLRADGPGLHTVTARLAGAAGATDEDAARAHVVAGDPGAVLVVSSRDGAARLAAATGRPARVVAPGDPALADAALAHDVVLLDDPSTSSLARSVGELLREHVASGAGLLVVGERHAFGRGPWHGRVLDTLSPLRALPVGDGTAVYLALDASASMAREWSPAAGTRAAVVRAAALRLVDGLPPSVVACVRPFAGTLLHGSGLDGSGPPASHMLNERGRAAVRAAVRGVPPPSGTTRLLPVLEEALAWTASRTSGARRIVVLSDLSTAEDGGALAGAVRAAAGGGEVTFVVPPGTAETGARDELAGELIAAGARVLRPVHPDEVASAFETGVVGSAAHDDSPAQLVEAAGAAQRVPGLRAPSGPVSLAPAHPAPDADVVLRSVAGAPAAAVRAHGLGRVAALGWRPLEGTPGAGVLGALLPAVTGATGRPVRAERVRANDGSAAGDVLVAVARPEGEPPRTGVLPTPQVRLHGVDGGDDRGDAPTVLPERAGVWRVTGVARDVRSLTVLDAAGRRLGHVGLDRPAAPETSSPARARRVTAGGGESPRGAGSRAAWAALAVLLVLAGHGLALRRRMRTAAAARAG